MNATKWETEKFNLNFIINKYSAKNHNDINSQVKYQHTEAIRTDVVALF